MQAVFSMSSPTGVFTKMYTSHDKMLGYARKDEVNAERIPPPSRTGKVVFFSGTSSSAATAAAAASLLIQHQIQESRRRD